MLKKVAFIISVCIASFSGKSQSSLYPWNTGVLSFGLGVTNVSIDTGIWTWKNKNPGIQVDSVQKIKFSHLSIPVRMEILDKHFYVNSNASFMLPFALSGSPTGYFGHLNQSFSFRLGGGVCLAKCISLIPTVQFETSNLYISGKGIPSYDILNSNKGIHYYAYMGTLYTGFGFTTYGSITKDIGFRIGFQNNKIQFADNYGNTERYHAGPRKIWDFALFVKKIPGMKKNCVFTFRYNIINQHINAYNMKESQPGYGESYNARPGANIHAAQFFLEFSAGIGMIMKANPK